MRPRFRYDKGIYQAAIKEREKTVVIVLVDDPANTWRTITNAVEQVSARVLEYYHTDKEIMWYQLSQDGLFAVHFDAKRNPHWFKVE